MKRMSYLSYILVLILLLVAAAVTLTGGAGSSDTALISLETGDDTAGKQYIGTVNGENIGAEYFEMRYSYYKDSPLGYEDPKTQTINALKTEAAERAFAKAYGLLPTQEEVSEYTDKVRADCQETAKEDEKTAATVDKESIPTDPDNEFWKNYEKYMAPLALIHSNVTDYISENAMDPLDPSGIEVKITAKDYFDSLE